MHKIIVVGTSAGGLHALQQLLLDLPLHFPVPILIVMHFPINAKTNLAAILSRHSNLAVVHPKDAEEMSAGCVYLAPPNFHMMVSDGKIFLRKGPLVNLCKPAIDPLFISAAQAYGKDTIGIVLTGMLNDGTAGLLAIKQSKGITIIQDPKDAEYSQMPQSALDNVSIDYCLPVKNMPALLYRLLDVKVD